MQEITGPVVSVDNDDFSRDTNTVPSAPVGAMHANLSSGHVGNGAQQQYISGDSAGGARSPGTGGTTAMPRKGTVHQIVSGIGDEHHVMTTPSGHVLRQHGAADGKQNPPKFSAIMNEYVGACFEENCNIGKFE